MSALAVAVVALLAASSACNLKKLGAADASVSDDVSDAATVTVGGTGAKNEKDVLRYAKEDKIDNEPATIAKDGTKAKTYPVLGSDVATLAKGTAVTKIAKYFATGVLVVFDDPTATDGSKLVGWVMPEALSAPVAGVDAAAHPTATTVFHTDSGAPVAHTDAGSAPTPASTGTISAATLFVQPTGGKCPAGFAPAAGGCKRPCAADAQCPRTTFCVSKFCSATK